MNHNEPRTLETLTAEDFERVVDEFIEKAAAWDGALPAETFFAIWESLAAEQVSPCPN